MPFRGLTAFVILVILLVQPGLAAEYAPGRSFVVELERGQVWQARNDVAIPGDTGTRFSLKDLIASPEPAYRVYAGFIFGERHELRALFAPLSLRGTDSLSQPVLFQDATFAAGVPTTGEYEFNSYRLTYRYKFTARRAWTLRAGLTAKVRDARIALSQNGLAREKTDLGIVPLLHFNATYGLGSRWLFDLEADALAAPQGRAEDLSFKVRYLVPRSLVDLSVGYRILEGGADNNEVYTFSLFHYLVGSVRFYF